MPVFFAAAYSRLFAWAYDVALRRAEAGGLRGVRCELLIKARGRTLEIGAGTGLNLEHYPDAVTELVLTEPSPFMASGLRQRLTSNAGSARVLDTTAERLPFEDGTMDTVVATLVLCTVANPVAVVDEIARVLAPGGQFLFLEHVRSSDPRFARWQDRFAGTWRRVAEGCHCNRDTLNLIGNSSLTLQVVRDVQLPNLGILVRPAVLGSASRGPR
jgi:ubiquinone/menaquinone biosynthesis C-methylase UbiE